MERAATTLNTWPIGIWIAIALACAPSPRADARQNLGFESAVIHTDRMASAARSSPVPGWRARGDDVTISVDHMLARSGTASLRVERLERDGRAGFSQTIDARSIDGDRLRLSAYVRMNAGEAAAAALRIRVDGGERLLYIGRERATSPANADGWHRIVIEAPLGTRAERVEIGGDLSGAGVVWFDDFEIETLQARLLPVPAPAAARYVGRALSVIDEHAVARPTLDWDAYREAVIAQTRGAVTEADAHLAVQYALAELGDGHSYFMSPQQMSRLDSASVGNARTGRAARPPQARSLFDGIAYLCLPGIAGGEHLDRVVFAETVQSLIGKLEHVAARGWILDLRGNEGGNLWPMLAGVGPLLGDGEIGASLRPGGERRSIWYREGRAGLGDYVQLRVRGVPVHLQRIDTPVAVLIDEETASAAEIIAMAFAGRPSSRSFGARTAGATTATRTFPLSDGAALMLAVARVADRHQRIIDGHLAPNEPIAEGDDAGALERQAVVQAARRWLERLP